jgi:hypothetical protein
MDAMHGQMGEVSAGAGMMAESMDSGMAVNHHLDIRVTDSSDNPVMDLTPMIRVTDKVTGESRDLPELMGLYGASMGPADFHYGQNVYLPPGTYTIRVLAGPADTAQFRDVVVMDEAMADMGMSHDMGTSHDMGMSHDMTLPAGTAKDGRMFSEESAATQALFTLIWGSNAAQEWVMQHDATLGN